MFGRKSPMDNRIDTLVGPNSRVNGDLSFGGLIDNVQFWKGAMSAELTAEWPSPREWPNSCAVRKRRNGTA